MDSLEQVAEHDRSIGGDPGRPSIYPRQLQHLRREDPGGRILTEHHKFGLSDARSVGVINQERGGTGMALPPTTRDALPPALTDTLRICSCIRQSCRSNKSQILRNQDRRDIGLLGTPDVQMETVSKGFATDRRRHDNLLKVVYENVNNMPCSCVDAEK